MALPVLCRRRGDRPIALLGVAAPDDECDRHDGQARLLQVREGATFYVSDEVELDFGENDVPIFGSLHGDGGIRGGGARSLAVVILESGYITADGVSVCKPGTDLELGLADAVSDLVANRWNSHCEALEALRELEANAHSLRSGSGSGSGLD